MKVYLWQNSIEFSQGVEEQLLIFLSCFSPERVKKLQKFINFCLKVGHDANLKLSQSTWRHMWLLWNVQNQHIMEWERSTTVVVLISGTFMRSRLIYDRCLPWFIQKIATIFQGLFKDHIRFSRTTYQEYNFKDCTKMHIPKTLRLELFALPTSLHFPVHLS